METSTKTISSVAVDAIIDEHQQAVQMRESRSLDNVVVKQLLASQQDDVRFLAAVLKTTEKHSDAFVELAK